MLTPRKQPSRVELMCDRCYTAKGHECSLRDGGLREDCSYVKLVRKNELPRDARACPYDDEPETIPPRYCNAENCDDCSLKLEFEGDTLSPRAFEQNPMDPNNL